MRDASDDEQPTPDRPHKKVSIGYGISAGSASPFRESSASPPPRRSKARPTSAPFRSSSDPDIRRGTGMFDIQRPQPERKQIQTEHDIAPTRSSVNVDKPNIVSSKHKSKEPKLCSQRRGSRSNKHLKVRA